MNPDMTWGQTQSGRKWDFAKPDWKAVHWPDVARALSNTSRFGGHTKPFYSVAEHCVRIHDFLKEKGFPRDAALLGLLHDAHEAYIGDIPTPLANVIGGARIANLKAAHDNAIFAKAGVSDQTRLEHADVIKHTDLVFLMSERDALLGPPPQPWPGGVEDLPRVTLERPGWFPEAAARRWLHRLNLHLSNQAEGAQYGT